MNTELKRTLNILLVDDDDIDAMCVERLLMKHECNSRLIRARDGQEALDIIKVGGVDKPYVVLLDINMPRMTGLEMLAVLRSDPNLSDTIVFMLSTSNNPTEIRQSYRLNAAAFIVKSQIEKNEKVFVDLLKAYMSIIELPS